MDDFEISNESVSEEENEVSSIDENHVFQNKRKCDSEFTQNKKLKIEDGKKKGKKDLYKPPTAEELNRLKEIENLFNSNLFRLQIEQLLEEIKVKQKYKTLFENWFKSFMEFIENIPEYGEIKVSELVPKKNKNSSHKQTFINELITFHTSSFKTDQDAVLKFIKPLDCTIFGLYKINSTMGPSLQVDIHIKIPNNNFHTKDYLNNRYLVKRDYYASYIALHLNKSSLCNKLIHIPKTPVLQVIPNISKKIEINLHITATEDCFKLSRFEPNKNNVKKNVFDEFEDVENSQLRDNATPYYNSIILHDLTLASNYKLAEDVLKNLSNVRDGVKLLIVWLRQRGLFSECYGISKVLLTQIILFLCNKKKINKHMSSYQVIRNFWVFLKTSNWQENPISICEDVKSETLQKFKENFDVVFIDKNGCYNLAAFLHYNVYIKLKSEAELAVKYLDNVKFDSFKALFMTKMDPILQYDALIILKDGNDFKNLYNTLICSEKCKYVGSFRTLIVKNILLTLCKGLNKRIINIVPFSTTYYVDKNLMEITLGVTLDPNNAFTIMEKGPESNTFEAAAFKKFWGELAECRRFADGSIREAIYFPTKTIREKRNIFKKIVNYVLMSKLKIKKSKIIGNQFEDMEVFKYCIPPFPVGSNEEANLKIITVFDEIAKKLRDCSLPLEITTVQGASDVFSYTSVYPPIPTNYKWDGNLTTYKNDNLILKELKKFESVPRYIEPVEGVIVLGMNSKWPNNLEALQHIKLGFYLELSKYLHNSKIVSNVKSQYIDILYKGLVFRFRLYNPREITALKKFVNPEGLIAFKDTKESAELDKKLNILPRIVGALHGLQLQNPSYGPSTALIKRWLRSQLIDEYHLPDIVVDLLNASLYLNSAPYNIPNLLQVAFLRFLNHIVEFDWNLRAVIANFNNELTKEQLDQFETNFQQNRQQFPQLCILTPYDEGKSLFSRKCTKEILRRFSLLAKSAYNIIFDKCLMEDAATLKELFIPNLQGYNVVIHLKPFLNSRRYQQIDFIKNNKMTLEEYDEFKCQKIPIVGFNPVQNYLMELRKHYEELALFFNDPYGGNIIGVLWQPKALENKEFKVSNIEGRKLVNNSLELNVNAIIDDFYVLGSGLVKTIERY